MDIGAGSDPHWFESIFLQRRESARTRDPLRSPGNLFLDLVAMQREPPYSPAAQTRFGTETRPPIPATVPMPRSKRAISRTHVAGIGIGQHGENAGPYARDEQQ